MHDGKDDFDVSIVDQIWDGRRSDRRALELRRCWLRPDSKPQVMIEFMQSRRQDLGDERTRAKAHALWPSGRVRALRAES